VSEEDSIRRFEPRANTKTGLLRGNDGVIAPAPVADTTEPLVWAIDTRHQPMFWFPRDCPRGTFWAGPGTKSVDIDRFLNGDRLRRVHAMEAGWVDHMRAAEVYAYRLPEETFRPHQTVGGYWVSTRPVDPIERVALGDLVRRHADAGIELRVVPSIWPIWDQVIVSTLEFSGSRLRNAARRST
jgi:hypothetical protein